MSLPPSATGRPSPRAGVGAAATMAANTNSSNPAIQPNTNSNNNINNNNNAAIDYRNATNLKGNPGSWDSEKDVVKEFDQYLESSIVDDDPEPNGFRSTSSSPQKDAVIFADQDTSVVIDVVPSPSHSFTPSPIYSRRSASAANTPLALTTLKRSNDQATEKIKIQGDQHAPSEPLTTHPTSSDNTLTFYYPYDTLC